MQRLHQIAFIISLLALSWLGMMAIHEFGHVIGALTSGGSVERVVLHPLTISRTDVSPNPNPLWVVWLGPVLGCAIPVIGWRLVPRQLHVANKIAMFFAGFCLLANGAYIAIGSFERIGDCQTMLQHGSPNWTLVAFGAITAIAGISIWHQLGSIREFLSDPSLVNGKTAYLTLLAAAVLAAVEFTFSPT
ncbi:hypothetical protein [Mariniblastus fucicola]|uniref:Peptidase family M50 n=1 Tax=Mariniblastus fucicola TaxID=980251 RepID=A0A5B9PRI8_9BACT|nr:hypothetical protein [Mariniblastus fucicola]QEG25131.1 hypothetical protein MFFC18_50540 [Mariniblastus fucicola]